MSPLHKGYGAAILQALITGFSFLLVKVALAEAATFDLLAYRFAVAALLALIPILKGKVKMEIAAADRRWILLLSLLYPCLFFLLQTLGLERVASAEAGIIQAAAPIFTLILASLFLQEKTPVMQKIFIFLSVAGMVFISLMKGANIGDSSLRGVAFLLLSTLSLAGYNVLTRRLAGRYSPFALSCLITFPGFILYLALALIKHMLAGTLPVFFAPLQNPGFIFAVLYLGGLSSLGSSYLMAYALARLEAARVSVFSSLATVVALVAGMAVLHEPLSWYHFLGTGMILAGVIGTNFAKTSQNRQLE